ncbi:MAG: AraC family transcriptional regulator [Thalassobius sp.]|nr:AraC family transcriptional regulator [Thalassovita sp.]
MRKENRKGFITVNSISELYKLLGISKPKHPLIGLIKLEDISLTNHEPVNQIMNFYVISLKRCFDSKLKYGQNYYDFDEGILAFMEPGQIISSEKGQSQKHEGWWLVFHPDFIRNYSLSKTIKDYGFFSYAVNEALHLSEKEETMLINILKNIETEYNIAIDNFSQDVMISHLELFLNYSNRFYNRQFITRKTANDDLLVKMETLLADYFDENKALELGLPSVRYFAEQLNVSPNYLSDMLRAITGQSTQQHIHHKIIERAKQLLSTTKHSVSDIAYHLGFERPQSFNKLFKSKTKLSPLDYRASFN